MATPQQFESIEPGLPVAEATPLNAEQAPPVISAKQLAFEGIKRVAAKNPIVNTDLQMRYIFPRNT
jgi:hypothetical protein